MAVLEIVINDDAKSTCSTKYTMNMIYYQRNINLDDVKIELVQVKDVARAYNTRIKASDAPWIMFMDAGDCFPDVYSLSMILNLLPTDEWDMAWMDYYEEFKTKNNDTWVNVVNDVDRYIKGKLFRRQYLLDKGIFFDETLKTGAEEVFMLSAISVTDYNRFAKISTKFIPYLHVVKDQRTPPTAAEIVRLSHLTNIATIKNIEKLTHGDRYMQAIMRAMCDAYYFTHMQLMDNVAGEITYDVRKLYTEHCDIINRIKPQDLEVFLDESQNKVLSMCNSMFICYGYEVGFDVDDDDFRHWIDNGCKEIPGKVMKKPVKKSNHVSSIPKVAVFCGTRNVYDSMESAAKSLMYHTKMDRIYFLIEDDKFPNPLPKCIKCLNVSGQTWFDPNGKNYKNAWTYMCMMRAVFAKLFQDDSKVLSLDIDVVVNDDISELWDIDLTDYYYAGVPETCRTEQLKTTYTNFGVIMMNLDMIRKTGIDDKIIASLNRDRWGCPEQDAFNHFCAGKIYALPSTYNATRCGHITAPSEDEKISHYAGIKYWKQFKPVKRYAEMTWEEVLGNV